MASNATRHVLVYDDACAMCRRWAARVGRWDRGGHIERVSIRDAEAARRFPWIGPDRMRAAMQLVAPDGTTHEGADAVEHVVRLLPGGRALTWPLALPGVRAVARALYGWIARRRTRAPCGIHCGPRIV